jgi:hypothetical protein
MTRGIGRAALVDQIGVVLAERRIDDNATEP